MHCFITQSQGILAFHSPVEYTQLLSRNLSCFLLPFTAGCFVFFTTSSLFQVSQAKVSEWNPVSQKLYKDSQASLRQASIDSSWLHSERSHATYYGGTLVGGRKSTSSKYSKINI